MRNPHRWVDIVAGFVFQLTFGFFSSASAPSLSLLSIRADKGKHTRLHFLGLGSKLQLAEHVCATVTRMLGWCHTLLLSLKLNPVPRNTSKL